MKTCKFISGIGFALLGLTLVSSTAAATMDCYEFGVENFSTGLSTLSVSVAAPTKKSETLTVNLKASRSQTHSAHATYECARPKKELKKINCYGDTGDFSLSPRGAAATLTLTYLNLGPHKPDVELDEDFAIYDVANDIDNGDSTDHAKEFVIQGKKVLCEK